VVSARTEQHGTNDRLLELHDRMDKRSARAIGPRPMTHERMPRRSTLEDRVGPDDDLHWSRKPDPLARPRDDCPRLLAEGPVRERVELDGRHRRPAVGPCCPRRCPQARRRGIDPHPFQLESTCSTEGKEGDIEQRAVRGRSVAVFELGRQDRGNAEKVPVGVLMANVRQRNEGDVRPLAPRSTGRVPSDRFWRVIACRAQHGRSELRSDP
jgi:hypothetical protein